MVKRWKVTVESLNSQNWRDYIINIIGIVFETRSDGKKLRHAPEKARDAIKLHHGHPAPDYLLRTCVLLAIEPRSSY
jgi:hypothetical protein